MDHPQTPRVLQPHLSAFQHRIVRVVGKVVQLRGETAVIDAGGQIDVVLNRVGFFPFSRGHCLPSVQVLVDAFTLVRSAHSRCLRRCAHQHGLTR